MTATGLRVVMSITTDPRTGGEDFGRLAEPFRRELVAYGYRMLGSVDDAEEIVQDVYLEAWRAYERFEARSSLRTWLYRIATRAFVKAAARRKRRPLPSDLSGPALNPGVLRRAASPEVTWLQPAPDSLLAGTLEDPAAVVVARHTMRLAFVAAMQVLPPRQRAVLILRDVLQWRSSEVAGDRLALFSTKTCPSGALGDRSTAERWDPGMPQREPHPLARW